MTDFETVQILIQGLMTIFAVIGTAAFLLRLKDAARKDTDWRQE